MINTKLNILGCWPERLNILFLLAQKSRGLNSFNILKNIPVVDIDEYYVPDKKWNVNIFNCYESDHIFNPNDNYALSVNGAKSKEIVVNYFKQLIQMDNKQFINLIHPSAIISKSVKLDFGIQIEPMSFINVLTSIGFGVNIKTKCYIGHHCEIGDYVTVNPGVSIGGLVKIGNNTTVGIGTSIRHKIKIGKNTIIGMGSAVVNDIPDNVVAYGNPCKVIRVNN